jgi:sterol desaturase/sphingolipid hydroxylase (fatty acid hydroxylase superfamily)
MISLVIAYLGFALLAPLCALAQRLWPSAPAPRAMTRGRAIDWSYWLVVTPVITGVCTRAATVTVAVGAALAVGWGFHDANAVLSVFHERSPLPFAAMPLWAQLPLAIVIVDFVSYWSHRARHHRRFFALHAVHHSARELDWLAAARMHPLDDLADNVVVMLPVLFLGFDPIVLVVLGPLLLLHTLFLHSSIRVSLGPLRYLIITPDLHRWHHARDPAAQGRNFGGVLAIWDVAFGTFELPATPPTEFGLAVDPLADTWHDQLVEPVRRVITAPTSSP